VEITQERAWNRESNVEMYMAKNTSQVMGEEEAEIARRLLGVKVSMIDPEVARCDGLQVLLITSNIKKFLVLPK